MTMKLVAPILLLFSLLACATPELPRPERVTDLIVFDHKVGNGAIAAAGQSVSVHYTGWLYDPGQPGGMGKKFDSSLDRNKAFVFPLGAGRVIKGWDQGVAGMQPGGKRTLIIPPQMAYGERNVGNGLIPPNSTLLFEVELLEASSPATSTPAAKAPESK
jgi:FKBP-type peptidyl-prolyl cis-trans isomerase